MENTFKYSDTYINYLKDESGLSGRAEAIIFPSNANELTVAVKRLLNEKKPFTVQGSKTGITGSAVPDGGHIISTSRMNRITGLSVKNGIFYLQAEPGVTLAEIEECLQFRSFSKESWSEISLCALDAFFRAKMQFFPPCPTEKTATIGGMFALNACGINSKYYGCTSKYVEEITIILSSGDTWQIPRGKYIFTKDGCEMPDGAFLPVVCKKEKITSNAMVCKPEMDLIDLFAGSEGMLGIVSSITLRLIPEPNHKWGVVCFFHSATDAVNFSEALLLKEYERTVITAIEFFDHSSLQMIFELKRVSSKLNVLPDLELNITSAVYVELISDENESELIERALFSLLDLFTYYGGDESQTWAASGNDEINKFRVFRHSAPESINLKKEAIRLSWPDIVKVSVDFTAPDKYFKKIYDMYTKDIERSGISAAIFGHVFLCHLHVNFLPENAQQMKEATDIILSWATQIVALGGCVASENGIGKLKKQIFTKCVPEDERRSALSTKLFFDRELLLNPNNYFTFD